MSKKCLTDEDLLRMLEESEDDECDDDDFLDNTYISTSTNNRRPLTHIENEQNIEDELYFIEQNVEGDVVAGVIGEGNCD